MKMQRLGPRSGGAMRRRVVGLLLALSVGARSLLPAIEPPVTGRMHGVTSSHELATESGFRILREGGSAADAAVAVSAVLGVVESWFSSPLGGEVWALHFDRESGEVEALDGVGPAGSGATLEFWSRPENHTRPGIHMAVVPGAWDGWMIWLARYGRLELPEILADAIRLAEEGFPVSPVMHDWILADLEQIREWPESRRIFLPEGRVPEVGETLVFEDMARTYREITDAYEEARPRGREAAFRAASDYYYRGPIAERIAAFSAERGGLLESDDFHDYHAEFVDPIHSDYHDGITVYQCPPNSQGITMLMAMNILRGFDFSEIPMQSAEMIHYVTEALKLAHTDNFSYVGDPDEVDVPVEELLSEEYARLQRERIDPERAKEWPIEPGPEVAGGLQELEAARRNTNTTTFHVIDQWGNGAAVTTSLGANFLVAGDTGIIINNRMRMFSPEEDNPNAVEPGKKVRHTSNPYIALRNGELYILGGNIGADSQPQGQLQQFLYVVEYGLDPQDAVTRFRFITYAFPSSTPPYEATNELAVEEGYAAAVLDELRRRGHQLTHDGLFGIANMAVVDPETGGLSFGADPRGVNRAMAE